MDTESTRHPDRLTLIDAHRDVYGVESICAVLPIAPSTYFKHRALRRRPELRCNRAKRDDVLRVEVDAMEAGLN